MNRVLSFISVAAVAALTGAAGAQHVNLELSLLVDTSGSISLSEYNLQKNGYAAVFQNPNFYSSVVGNGNSIAVNFVEWSGSSQQSQRVAWTLINSQASATAFGNAIAGLSRAFDGGQTAPQSAMSFAATHAVAGIWNNTFTSDKQIVDVSGDGVANSGDTTGSSGRTALISAGIHQINGLVIGGDSAVLNYYNDKVKFGAGSFVHTAANFNDFATAIQEKIHIEVSQAIPLPGAAGMAGVGLGIVALRRRRSV